MKKLVLLTASLFYSFSSAFSQDSDSLRTQLSEARQNRYPKRPIQIGFVPPLSTNGLAAGLFSNRVSINAIGGYAAALDGAEFSGIFSLEKDYAKGAQFSGILNGVRNEVDGAQFAGIVNVVGGPLYGAQFGGIANVVGKTVNGAQFAGIANISGTHVKGAQIAGITNIAESVEGIQIAGIANVAKRVKGTQIGLINIAENVDGAQIGFLNLAKNGYHRFEAWGGEALHANIGYKMGGNRKFYNIFALGAAWPKGGNARWENLRWGYGYGIGTNQFIGQRNQLSIEAMTYQIQEEGNYWDELNLLNQVRLSFIFPLHNRIALTVTPTFNVQVTGFETNEGVGTEWVSWDVFDRTYHRRWDDEQVRVRMWPGLNVGIQF
ncbi:LA_2272 family surface repeat-containing protein [Larkinella bovis]|uniref:LA_2272 family surface repeat-containing protein n=1 Tax=Larkinella bovis TaxID=683041 RepID=A0ABW0I999_9BACT